MKKQIFLFLFIFQISGFMFSTLAQEGDSPGWMARMNVPAITPDDWDAVVDGEASGADFEADGVATSETEITGDITALARALENDPIKIFEYVRNRIDYVLSFGIRNNATATLWGKRGNDLDQAALLIALLQAADSSSDAHYRKGSVYYPSSYLSTMLGVQSSNVVSCLNAAGIPATTGPAPYTNYTIVTRYWVRTTIDGTTYNLDPAYKEYETEDGVDVLTAIGYSRTQFVAQALSGATETSNSLQSVNETSLRSSLTQFSTSWVSYVRANYPQDDPFVLLGGRRASEEEVTALTTNIPNAFYSYALTNYTTLPTSLVSTLRIQYRSIDKTFKSYETAGKRVSVFHTGTSGAPQLRVDGDLISTGSATTSGTTNTMTFTVSVPNSVAVTGTVSLIGGQASVILNDFGSSSPEMLDHYSQTIQQAYASGSSSTSEVVRGGTLFLIGTEWLLGQRYVNELTGKLLGVAWNNDAVIGVVGQQDGYYIDVPLNLYGMTHSEGNTAKAGNWFRAKGLLTSALEHGVLEQTQGTNNPSASTVKIIHLTNQSTNPIYYATRTNWVGSSGVASKLTGYSSSALTTISNYLFQNYQGIVPKNGSVTVSGASWSGAGYILFHTNNTLLFRISGGYSGGFSFFDGDANFFTAVGDFLGSIFYKPAGIDSPMGQDPVELTTGDFTVQNADLILGQREPKGFNFNRLYNSAQVVRQNPLGYGWTHSYDIRVLEHTDLAVGLGGRQATDAAALTIYSLVANDLYENETPMRAWILNTLAAQWAMDQLTENARTVQAGFKSLKFIRLADNNYNPPPNSKETLVRSNGVYVLQKRFGETLTFDTNNRLSQWTDADQNALTFSYNSQTNLEEITDPYGRTLTFTYVGSTQLTSVADSSGRSVIYAYSSGNLSTYTDPESKTWTYTYDTNRWITSIQDPLSQITVSNIYDGIGCVATQINGSDHIYDFYVAQHYRAVEQNQQTNQTIYTFDRKGQTLSRADALGNTRYFSYDEQGRLTNEIDPRGLSTVFQYDDFHNLTNWQSAIRTLQYVYDSENHLIEKIDELGNSTFYGYDSEHHLTAETNALGYITSYGYTSAGLIETITDPKGNTTTYTYDSYGNPATITRTDGGTETTTFDSLGNLTKVVDANNHTNSFIYNNRRQTVSEIDGLGFSTSNIFDSAGNLVTNVDKNGNSTRYTYTPTYNLRTTTFADGAVVSNQYDNRDYLITVTDGRGNMWSNSYDDAGNLLVEYNPLGHSTTYTYDENGNVIIAQDALGNLTSNRYDSLNRLVSVVDPEGNLSSNQYDAAARLIAVIDAAGKTTTHEYDALGRKTKTIRPDGEEEEYFYDAIGNLIAFENAKGNRWTFGFDGMNRKIAETNALGYVTRFSYDDAGNLLSKSNANGTAIAYSYDARNLLTNKTFSGENCSYHYDRNGNVTNMIGSSGTNTFRYDTLNRLIAGGNITNRYDLNGNRTNLVYLGNLVAKYSFDAANRLTGLTDWSNRTTSFSYDSANRETNILFANNVTASYELDDNGRVTAYSYSGTSNFINRAITRNTLGFKTVESISAGLEPTPLSGKQFRNYNAADQLIHNSANDYDPDLYEDHVCSFDQNGNLTSVVVTATGSVVSATYYSYDAENRLTQISGTSTQSLIYDGQGNLVRLNENGSVKNIVVDYADPLKRPLIETTTNGLPTRYFIWSGQQLVSIVETNSAVYFAHADELGNILALSDTNGSVFSQFAYTPYGQDAGSTGLDSPFKFMGAFGVRTIDDNLYLTHYRAYDAQLMRFLQVDPIGLEGGNNFYLYASANPAFFIDPLGLVDWALVGQGAIGVVANGAMTIGGAFFAGTGAGAVVAVYGAYQTGASVGNIINGIIDNPAGPVGPVSAASQSVMLMSGVDPNSDTYQYIDYGAQAVDVTIPLVASGRLDWRLQTEMMGPPGTLAGTITKVVEDPSTANAMVKGSVLADTFFTVGNVANSYK